MSSLGLEYYYSGYSKQLIEGVEYELKVWNIYSKFICQKFIVTSITNLFKILEGKYKLTCYNNCTNDRFYTQNKIGIRILWNNLLGRKKNYLQILYPGKLTLRNEKEIKMTYNKTNKQDKQQENTNRIYHR